MILIRSIDVIEIDRDPAEILAWNMPGDIIPVNGGAEAVEYSVMAELVQGRRYVRRDGKEIVIGVTKQAQDIIGIQYEAWGSLQSDYEAARKDLSRTAKELKGCKESLRELHEAGFFRRLKMLFTRGK